MKRLVLLLLVLMLGLCGCMQRREYIGDLYAPEYVYATGFCEDRAWVWVEYSGSFYPYLIDSDGRIVCKEFVHPDPFTNQQNRSTRCTNFARGVSLIETENGTICLVDRSGTIVWQSNVDGLRAGKWLLGNNSDVTVNIMLPDDEFVGYFVVKLQGGLHNETMKGVVGPDGKWVIRPADNAADFQIQVNRCYIQWATSDEDNHWQYHAVNMDTGDEVHQGEGVDMAAVLKAWQWEHDLRRGNGMAFDSERQGFVNREGETVIDLSAYELGADNLFFTQGICPFLFGKDDKLYATAIDREGRQVTAPFIYTDPVFEYSCLVYNDTIHNVGIVSENLMMFGNRTEPGFLQCAVTNKGAHYYDLQGNQLPWEYDEMHPFGSGLALVHDGMRYFYIHPDGTRAEFKR